MTTRLTRREVAALVAQDIPDGSYVNLGIGAPTLVSDLLRPNDDIVLHTENGMLGMGPTPRTDEIDPDLVNAGKEPVTQIPGASYFHHADSFSMIRGRHIDICVLGAFQVSERGDLANWSTGEPDAIPAVGGAMDLAVGARQVFVLTDLFTKAGESKLVQNCTYPLTAPQCVSRVYTDYGIFEVSPNGFAALELFGDNQLNDLVDRIGVAVLDHRRKERS